MYVPCLSLKILDIVACIHMARNMEREREREREREGEREGERDLITTNQPLSREEREYKQVAQSNHNRKNN